MPKILLVLFVLSLGLSMVIFGGQPAAAQSPTGTSNIVVQTIPGQTAAQKLATRAKSSWSWYVVRGAGFVAATSLVALMISGMGLVSGYTFRFMEPLTAWATHRALGIVFGLSILLHLIGLLFDHFVPFSLAQVLVPGLSNYKPISVFGVQLGALPVTLGVLAFYGTIAVVVTSLLWVEKKPKIWKLTHLLSYLVMAFVFVHALYLGTDLAHGFWRWLWIAAGIMVGVAITQRLWRARTA